MRQNQKQYNIKKQIVRITDIIYQSIMPVNNKCFLIRLYALIY